MDHYSIFDPQPPEKEHGAAPAKPAQAPGEESSPSTDAASSDPLYVGIYPEEKALPEVQEAAVAIPPSENSSEAQAELAGSELDSALQALVQKAQYLSNANGAAIALREGREVVCRAASGSSAPDRGARLQIKSGLTAECLRSGELLSCENVMSDTRVDLESCKRLGIECIIIAPIRRSGKVAGVLELFSSHAYSFQERDIETVKGLAEEIGKMLEGSAEEPSAFLEEAAPAASEVLEDVQPYCTGCGAAIPKGIVFCPECGAIQEDEPAAKERDWKARLSGRRLLVPAVFVAMALVVAVAPIPQGSPRSATAGRPQQVAAAMPGNAGIVKPVSANSGSSPAKPTTADAPANGAKSPTVASSVKELLGGVSSDFSKLLPVNEKAEPEASSNGDPNLKVWVDTRKGFYYCPGDEQYGHTPKGTYMTQREAESNYYIPALIKPCM